MGLKIYKLHNSWTLKQLFSDGQWCPVCGWEGFSAEIPAGGVGCTNCGATFSCRGMADPGLVIDCFPKGYVNGRIDKNDHADIKYLLPEPDADCKFGISFWQVLKDCDGGLDGRSHWCSTIPKRFYVSRSNGGPAGKELFFYNPYELAEFILAAKSITEDKPQYPNIQQIEEYAKDFQGEKGYYTRNQCYKVFKQDAYWVHRCIPNEHEKPLLT